MRSNVGKFIIKSISSPVVKHISRTALLLYLLLLFYLTFLSQYYGRDSFHTGYNIIPLKTILETLINQESLKSIIINIFGNIAAFVPMGLLIPVAFPISGGIKRVFAAVLLTSASIEIVQFITAVGFLDIDDILLNVLGGLLGYVIYIKAVTFVKYKSWRDIHEQDTVKQRYF